MEHKWNTNYFDFHIELQIFIGHTRTLEWLHAGYINYQRIYFHGGPQLHHFKFIRNARSDERHQRLVRLLIWYYAHDSARIRAILFSFIVSVSCIWLEADKQAGFVAYTKLAAIWSKTLNAIYFGTYGAALVLRTRCPSAVERDNNSKYM